MKLPFWVIGANVPFNPPIPQSTDERDPVIFNATFTRFVRRIRNAFLLLGAFGMACTAVSCEAPAVTKDLSVLNTATRIEVIDSVSQPFSRVTDAGRIQIARDFIQQYEKGWRSPRWQGSAISPRRFNFWDGERYLGEFGIHLNTITVDGYYQEAPAEDIAKIAALFELKWPPDR